MDTLVRIIKENPDAVFGKGASEEEIAAAEEELSLSFSAEYRQYLSSFSLASINGSEFTGLCKSQRLNVVTVTEKQRLLNPGINSDWYVIEETNIDGIVIWQDSKGIIFQTSPCFTPECKADSFADYIKCWDSKHTT